MAEVIKGLRVKGGEGGRASGEQAHRMEGMIMTSQVTESQAVEERLDRLEQENHRLKRAGAVLGLGVAALILMGQALPQGRTVEAESFIVRDSRGQVRALLTAPPDGTVGLFICDPAGVLRASLRVLADGTPGLLLSDQVGQARTLLNVQGDGVGGLLLYDRSVRPRAWLSILADGTGGLALFDEGRESRAWLRQTADGSPGLTLWDASGNVLRNAP